MLRARLLVWAVLPVTAACATDLSDTQPGCTSEVRVETGLTSTATIELCFIDEMARCLDGVVGRQSGCALNQEVENLRCEWSSSLEMRFREPARFPDTVSLEARAPDGTLLVSETRQTEIQRSRSGCPSLGVSFLAASQALSPPGE